MGLVLLIVVLSSIWVYFDARSLGAKKGVLKGFFDMGPGGWFWVCLLLWIIGFPAYLAKRGAYKRARAERSEPRTTTSASADALAQIEKLGQLKQQGILTQEEFDTKKKQLLGL
jgi:hypothetical protein